MSNNSQRIIIIPTQYFSPEIFQINDLCDWLSNNYKLIIIAPQPSYPTYKDIKRNKKIIFNKNVKIIRFPVYKRNGSLLGFFLNQITYLLLSIPITLFFTLIKKPKYIVVPQYSPFTSIIPAFIASLIRKVEIFVWVFDLWPESIKLFRKKNIIFSFIYRFLIYITNIIIRRFDKVLISSPKFRYAESLKNARQIINLNSWEPQNNAVKNIKISEESEKIIISSVGNIGNAHDINLLKQFLLAADRPNIIINFAGGGSKLNLLKEYVDNKKISNVYFYNYISKLKAKELISNSHFSLIPFKKSEISDTIPYRFITSLASSTPLLSFNKTYVSQVIERNNIGICFSKYSKKNSDKMNLYFIEKFILNLSNLDLSILSLNAANFFNKYYSYSSTSKKLNKIFID